MFGSNNYLGLTFDPAVVAAARAILETAVPPDRARPTARSRSMKRSSRTWPIGSASSTL
jgi:hypothetical protein